MLLKEIKQSTESASLFVGVTFVIASRKSPIYRDKFENILKGNYFIRPSEIEFRSEIEDLNKINNDFNESRLDYSELLVFIWREFLKKNSKN